MSPASEGPGRTPELDEDENGQEANKNYLKSPWWWAGIVLMTVGEAGNFLA